MENKPIEASAQSSCLQENNIQVTSDSSDTHSNSTRGQQLKFFRKIAYIPCLKYALLVRKRRYCISAVAPGFLCGENDSEVHAANQILCTQKSINRLRLLHEKSVQRRAQFHKRLSRLKIIMSNAKTRDSMTYIGNNLKNLQTFSFHSTESNSPRKITNAAVESLAKQIEKNLRVLKNLDLGFQNCAIDDTAISYLADHIGNKNLKSLQTLRLNLEYNQMTDDATTSLAENISNNLKSLKHLSIGIERCSRISIVAVKNFVQHLGTNFSSLQSLSLKCAGHYAIDDVEVGSLGEHIGSNLKFLRDLSIGFPYTFNDDSVKILFTRIGNGLNSLLYISLNFTDIELSDDGVKTVIDYIGNNLRSLQQLHLSFHRNNKITDLGIKNLAEQLGKNLKSLTHLSLWLSRHYDKSRASNYNVTDDGIRSLSKSIASNLESLQHLHLDFIGNYGINESGNMILARFVQKNIDSFKYFAFYTLKKRFNSVSSFMEWFSEQSK